MNLLQAAHWVPAPAVRARKVIGITQPAQVIPLYDDVSAPR
jgi:hypothetical protein